MCVCCGVCVLACLFARSRVFDCLLVFFRVCFIVSVACLVVCLRVRLLVALACLFACVIVLLLACLFVGVFV